MRNQSDLFKDGALGTDKVVKYGEGLCWVLLYYFSGVPSWTWFYPYHYGPLASDLKGLSQTKVKFQKGLPFKPFDQLMGVLPPRSAHALPFAYKGLMIDEDSNIIDFYPSEFETDTDGKRYLWQGICKLPFIEEERLLLETKKLENELKDHEMSRNMQTLDRLFVKCSSKESRFVVLHSGTRAASKKIKDAIMLDCTIEGIKGTLHLMPEDLTEPDDNNKGEYTRKDLCMLYEINQGFQFVPRLLERVNIPEKTVDEEDIVETVLWHEASNNSNWFQNRRPIKLERKSEPSSQTRAPAFISKGAGCGFSLGRVKTPAAFPTQAEAREQISSSSDSSSCWDYGNRGHQPCVTKPEYDATSKAGYWRRDEYGGMQGLRISESNPRPMSNIRPRPVGSNFGPSRSGSTYGASEDCRSNNPSRGYQNTGRGWTDHQGTGRGRGRGWFATNQN